MKQGGFKWVCSVKGHRNPMKACSQLKIPAQGLIFLNYNSKVFLPFTVALRDSELSHRRRKGGGGGPTIWHLFPFKFLV